MPVVVACPSCAKSYRVREENLGSQVNCRACGSADAKLKLTGVIGLVAKAKICFAMSCNENSKGNETRGCR